MRKMLKDAAVFRRAALPVAAAATLAMTAGATAANAAGPVYIGAQLSDSVPVSPAEFIPGAIVFDLYLLTEQSPACDGATRVFTDTKAVTGPGTITSDPYTAVNTGTYQWVASYYDTSYQLIARGACPDATEQTKVVPHGVVTTPHDARPGPLQPPATPETSKAPAANKAPATPAAAKPAPKPAAHH